MDRKQLPKNEIINEPNMASTTGVILNLLQTLPVVAHHPPQTLKQVQGDTVDDEYSHIVRIREVLEISFLQYKNQTLRFSKVKI